MADSDPFESPKVLLSGGARHIETFSARLTELRTGTEWANLTEGKEDGEVYVNATADVPADMRQIAFDIVNNLRSALDHAVFASTLALTGHDRSGTKFPFGDTDDELRRDAKNGCKNVPQEILDYVLAFQTYRAGNPLLWGLNKLRNIKNHRVLVPVAAAPTFGGEIGKSEGAAATYEWDHTTGRLKVILNRPPPGTAPTAAAVVFTLELVIGTGAFRGEPALGLFNRLSSEVERVVSAIEAETARLLRERGG